ncbi:hypothetical protein MPH47_03675 [Psychrobacillus psychrodurans]|uniref:hypothetical protein n=1 Tax=Psychrobacillus psychrodurans TaxID=126157 RepID=UPI0008F04F48|nr:hypothetical protein [Psychrobacillus psychrodurans]MCK1996343.1 hypothetical protein [Psychrobacillus psychrodurans]MCZ8539357.1 hypothetical protein [Psychrobacillus psychrodurans]SFM37189.1 hypothetical protein SAMN05421832_102191 [Psychrobacillus psychrodurans]
MHIKKFVMVISAFMIYFILLPSIEALAAPELNVKVTTGFNGKAKYGEGLPISLTVENKGDAFSGDIVLDLAESYNLGNAQSIPFEIGAGETKTIQVGASGLAEDYMYQGNNVQMIHFFEGGWEKGKSITFKGNKTFKTNFQDPATIYYLTLTESADRLKVLNQLKQPNQMNDEIIHVAQQSDFVLPEEAVAWEMADYIIIDEFVIADLTEQQQQALIDYVSYGGIMVVGASDNVAAELGSISGYLPLNLHTTTQSITAQQASALTANNLLSNDLKIYDASLTSGSTPSIQLDGTLLAATKQVGSGTIIQTTFSLGDAPLAADPVYSDLMSSILQSVQVKNTQSMYGYNTQDELVYNLGGTNSLFSSFKVSTPLMIGIVIVYMIIIVPLLYIILKRKDKREYAWGIIPLTAIIASLAIFGYGAKDRIARPQVQQSSFLQVNEDKSLHGYYAESILSNKGGDFTFEAPVSTTMVAQRGTNSFTGQTANVHENAIMEKHATNSELTFRDVGYWSVSSLFGETQVQDVGNFEVDLRVDSSKILGTVQNNFPFGLKDVAIWSGSKLYKLGDLAVGEKLEVDKDLGTVMLMPISNPYVNTNYGAFANNQMDLLTQRKQALYSSSIMFKNSNSAPAITGFAEDNILPIELKDKKVELSALHLVIQPFTATTIFSGEFTLPANMFTVNVNTEEYGKYMEPVQNSNLEWYLDDGEYNVFWTVPETLPVDKVNWTQLQIANTDRNSHTIEIWNLKTESFEEITESRFTLTENIDTYINETGIIHYKLIKKSVQGDPYTRLPEVRVKGEVK